MQNGMEHLWPLPSLPVWPPSFAHNLPINRFTHLDLSWDNWRPLGKLSKAEPRPAQTHSNNFSANALAALTNVPEPNLSHTRYFLWDEAAQSVVNDDDGIVDAGETIDLALVIKNHWGSASNVQVTLSAQAKGAVDLDPYVFWDIDTVAYDSVGSFATDDNGLTLSDDGLPIGATSPFRFTVDADTPNEHIIPILVTIRANNGLDQADPTDYEFQSRFNLLVKRGRSLPSLISSDEVGTPGGDIDTDGMQNGVVTLDDSALWLVEKRYS